MAHRRIANPLDGVPITIKDNIGVKGIPTPVGTLRSGLLRPMWSASQPEPTAPTRRIHQPAFQLRSKPEEIEHESVALLPARARRTACAPLPTPTRLATLSRMAVNGSSLARYL